MKRGLYVISINDSHGLDTNTDGVFKKIYSQIRVLNNSNCNCELINLENPTGNYFVKFFKMFSKDLYPYIDVSDINYMYIRRLNHTCVGVISFLSQIRKSNPNIKIILEIPTWPYESEYRSVYTKFALIIDKIYRKKLVKYVDLITSYSNDKKILNIPVLPLKNGIDCSSIPIAKINQDFKRINLIAVAKFSNWHGYDRLIEGLNNYYLSDNDVHVFIKFVGDGPELNKYKNLVNKYKLCEYVSFEGNKGSEELNIEFDSSDIAVCSLGCHRKNLYLSSELKSREYLCRGLPMITSTKIDILNDEFKYNFRVPENDSPINIQEIVVFYKKIIEKTDIGTIRKEIRLFAERECDMDAVFKPVVDYIYEKKEGEENEK